MLIIMGIGLLLLASTGKENNILSNNPKITFFKKVYKKNSYFFNEVTPQYFKSSVNFGDRVTMNISKSGDMIKDISLYIELPEISKSNHSSLPDGIKQFKWTNKIAFSIIKYIDLEIGGILISRLYNDWINLKYELYNEDLLDTIIGKVKILTDYSNGKDKYKLYLPIDYFFNLNSKYALPIVALKKQDVKIHIQFNPITSCFNETPTHYFTIDSTICLFNKGEYIRQNVDGQNAIGEFVYFDINKKRVYYNKVFNDFNVIPRIDYDNDNNQIINTKYNIIGDNTLFSIQPKYDTIIIKDESYFFGEYPTLKDCYLLVNYIFLSNDERWIFLNNKLSYIIPIVQNVLDKKITNTNTNYKLSLTNPHKVLIWRAQLSLNIERNDYFDYTTFPITKKREPIILNSKIILNSIPRTQINNYEHYTYLQNYINKYGFYDNFIYNYSFGLNPKLYEPFGTLNFSKIDDAYLQLQFNKIINYQIQATVKAYGIYYNIFIIENGTSSIKFSI